jgi:hypothetical protein
VTQLRASDSKKLSFSFHSKYIVLIIVFPQRREGVWVMGGLVHEYCESPICDKADNTEVKHLER